jgi:hypothetical protein
MHNTFIESFVIIDSKGHAEMPMTFTVIDVDSQDQMQDSMFFNPVDVEMLRSPASKKKIDSIFRKNRYDINIAVVLQRLKASDPELKRKVERAVGSDFGRPDALTIVYNNNVTSRSNYVPMTAWILAHRIGHMTMMNNGVTSANMWRAVNEGLKPIFGEDLDVRAKDRTDKDYDWGPEIPLLHLMPFLLTMRSARIGKLTVSPDYFAEMLAQHIITGKTTLLRAEHWQERIDMLRAVKEVARNDIVHRVAVPLNTRSKQEINSYLARAEHLINKALEEFMASCMGKVMVF